MRRFNRNTASAPPTSLCVNPAAIKCAIITRGGSANTIWSLVHANSTSHAWSSSTKIAAADVVRPIEDTSPAQTCAVVDALACSTAELRPLQNVQFLKQPFDFLLRSRRVANDNGAAERLQVVCQALILS